MNYRQHLFIDSILQTIIIFYFSYQLGSSAEQVKLLQLMSIMLFGWQFLNGIISYKFFERRHKRLFVRVTSIFLGLILGLRGLLWLGLSILPEQAYNLTLSLEPVLLQILTVFSAMMALWYLYITIKDLYNVFFNTV
jgi:hypothetical protein